MRAALLALVTLAVSPLASVAAAEVPRTSLPPPIVWKNRVKQRPAGVASFTNVSNKVYLNDCANNRCTVTNNNYIDNSRTNRSSIPVEGATVTLPAYPYGSTHWNDLVACVRETFLPFDIEVVTSDPGNVPHFEVMIGGRDSDLNPDPEFQAGGVAPFIGCGATEPDVISFVFPETTDDLEYLCGAVVQEACHVWGLDHELHPDDPLTYLDLGSLKRFQNEEANCGESDPRGCFCGGSTQNSWQYMADTFGPANLAPPTLSITSPAPGAWVKPAFAIHAEMTSQLSPRSAMASMDGSQFGSTDRPPFVFNAPTALAGGSHTVTIAATDAGGRSASASVMVNVTASCVSTPCASGYHCLGGYCLPGADVAGGLGAACTGNTECVTGSCGSDGTEMLCTGPCDANMACPSGFTCLAAGSAGVCWPGEESGCCSTSDGTSAPAYLFAGFGGLVLLLRRRRRA